MIIKTMQKIIWHFIPSTGGVKSATFENRGFMNVEPKLLADSFSMSSTGYVRTNSNVLILFKNTLDTGTALKIRTFMISLLGYA